MQAVILAAGMGTRIRNHFELPKGFIPIANKPIIAASIKNLKQAGIQKIIIVAGHLAEHYVELEKQDPAITVVINHQYAIHSSLYSLYCARNLISDDFLLLESDIIYEKRALTTLLAHPTPNAILLSGSTHSGDEVYVQTNHDMLVIMSKNRQNLDLANVSGEFVGINKLSLSAFQQLILLLEKDNKLLHDGYYEEDGLVTLAAHTPIHCVKIPDLLWREIDNIDQLKQAKIVYDQMISYSHSEV